MKQFNLVKILMCVSLFNILNAQCSQDILKYNSGYVILQSSNPDNYLWLKLSSSATLQNQKLYIDNYTIPSSATLSICSAQSCDTINNVLHSQSLGEGTTTINLSSLSLGSEFFLIIYSPDLISGSCKVEFKGSYSETFCDPEYNIHNSIQNPTPLDIINMSNSVSISSCNDYTSLPSNTYIPISNYELSAIKWFTILNNASGVINVDLESTGIDYPSLIIVDGSRDHYQLVYQEHNLTSTSHHKNIPVKGMSNILIGVASSEDNEGAFNLTVTKHNNQNNCVDYYGNGDTLEVISTSMNSALTGPFKSGEVIEFRYTLNSWVPLANNWPHSITLEHSQDWVIDTFPSLADTTHWSFDSTSFINPSESKNWNWYVADPSDTSQTLNHGNFAGEGWYFTNNNEGTLKDITTASWGARIKHLDPTSNPLIQLHFFLKLKDSLDCQNTSLYVRVHPHSDYETGYFPILGCSNNGYEEITATVSCCQPNPNRFALSNKDICHGDNFTINYTGKENFLWECTRLNKQDIVAHQVQLSSKQLASNIFLDSITLKLKVISDQYCPDSTYKTILVHQTPEVDLGNDLITCQNSNVIIINSKYNPNFHYNWYVNNAAVSNPNIDHFAAYSSSDQTIRLEAYSDARCINKDEVAIKLDDIQISNTSDSILLCQTEHINELLNLKTTSKYSKLEQLTYYNSDKGKISNLNHLDIGDFTVEAKNKTGCVSRKTLKVYERVIYDTVFIYESDTYSDIDIAVPYENLTIRKGGNQADSCTKINTVYIVKQKHARLSTHLSCAPNPNKGEFTLSIPNNLDLNNLSIVILTPQGIPVWTSQVIYHTSNISAKLPPGIYILALIRDNKSLGSLRMAVE